MKRIIVALGIGAFWSAGCFAAESFHPLDVKLGLWETTTVEDTTGLPPIPPEALARLTPEQRTKMEGMMKARMNRGPQTKTRKSCLTKDKLNEPLNWGDNEQAKCKKTIVTSNSSKQEFHVECTAEQVNSTGDIRFEALSPENVKGSAAMNVTSGGRTMTVKVNFTGKWIGSSCGDVKD